MNALDFAQWEWYRWAWLLFCLSAGAWLGNWLFELVGNRKQRKENRRYRRDMCRQRQQSAKPVLIFSKGWWYCRQPNAKWPIGKGITPSGAWADMRVKQLREDCKTRAVAK